MKLKETAGETATGRAVAAELYCGRGDSRLDFDRAYQTFKALKEDRVATGFTGLMTYLGEGAAWDPEAGRNVLCEVRPAVLKVVPTDPLAAALIGWAGTAGAVTVEDWAPVVSALRRAAKQDDPLAQRVLAGLYATGTGVRKHPGHARTLLTKAAAAGDALAQDRLGLLISGPEAPAADQKKAAALFRTAAERGLPLAMTDYADALAFGAGIPQDDRRAFGWYRRAAKRGVFSAMLQTGRFYLEGRGTAADPGKA
ncbi:MAG: tetratricopeptide repeat protein, partial [Methanomethylophilus sp.]